MQPGDSVRRHLDRVLPHQLLVDLDSQSRLAGDRQLAVDQLDLVLYELLPEQGVGELGW